MKVIKKQPKQFDAYQWNGYSREDYIEFIKPLNKGYGFDTEYFDESNKLVFLCESDLGTGYDLEVKELGWVVLGGYQVEVLTNKEFKEQFEVVKGC